MQLWIQPSLTGNYHPVTKLHKRKPSAPTRSFKGIRFHSSQTLQNERMGEELTAELAPLKDCSRISANFPSMFSRLIAQSVSCFLWNTTALINIFIFSYHSQYTKIQSVKQVILTLTEPSLWTGYTQEDLPLSRGKSPFFNWCQRELELLNKARTGKLSTALPEAPFRIWVLLINFSHLLLPTHSGFPSTWGSKVCVNHTEDGTGLCL